MYGFRKYSSAQAQPFLEDRLINSIGLLLGKCLFIWGLGNPDAKLRCPLHSEFRVQRNAGVTSPHYCPAESVLSNHSPIGNGRGVFRIRHASVCGCAALFRKPSVVLCEKAGQLSGVQQRQAVHRPCTGDIEQVAVEVRAILLVTCLREDHLVKFQPLSHLN